MKMNTYGRVMNMTSLSGAGDRRPTDASAHAVSSVDDARIVSLRAIESDRSRITVADNRSGELPFEIRRVYYLYDLPALAERGGHSHRAEQRLIVAAAGCFDVTLDDGARQVTVTLRHPSRALYIPPGLWITVGAFSAGAVALALCSTLFDEGDYVRSYDEFLSLTSCKRLR